MRGVNFGASPSVQGEVTYKVCSHFTLGGNGSTTTNGVVAGYGNTINLFGDIKIANHLTARVTDYFFMNTGVNDYFYEYGKNKGDGHFDEVSLQYKNDVSTVPNLKLMQIKGFISKPNTTLARAYQVPLDISPIRALSIFTAKEDLVQLR